MADSNSSLLAGLPAAGSYRLDIRLDRRLRLRVGALGVVEFPAGSYVYCGSARRRLPARVARHLRRRKPRRWHIDYLLAHTAARVYQVHARPRASECGLVRRAMHRGGRAVVPGFGSSDCPRCPAHLIYVAVEAEPQ